MIEVVRRPGVQFQLALAAVAIVASLTIGGQNHVANLVACAASVCWIVRAISSRVISPGLDLFLLALMLLGSAVAAVPTGAVAIEPMVGSIVIVVGDVLRPQWARWAYPAGATVAAAIGFAINRAIDAVLVVGVVLVLSVVGGAARRARGQTGLLRLKHLEREYAADIERLRIAAERVIEPQRLRQRFLGITAREAEVLSLIAHGYSNEEIATELYVSITTVKSHVNSLFAKLPARDRAQAIALVVGTAHHRKTPGAEASPPPAPR